MYNISFSVWGWREVADSATTPYTLVPGHHDLLQPLTKKGIYRLMFFDDSTFLFVRFLSKQKYSILLLLQLINAYKKIVFSTM